MKKLTRGTLKAGVSGQPDGSCRERRLSDRIHLADIHWQSLSLLRGGIHAGMVDVRVAHMWSLEGRCLLLDHWLLQRERTLSDRTVPQVALLPQTQPLLC